MRYVVAYDISNDKRRKKMGDLLERYGIRVNFSVFEIELNATKYKKLLEEIEDKELLNKKYDSVRFYHICENCLPKCSELSNAPDPFEAKEMFI
ncbi:MAG: CRISPR-associated endonuclease Cas2 [Epsilonproteobacteria bacterium]|nr:CRISPR-associated endonuclease Cas2 [Campylobacterota bacterium]